MFVSVSRIKRGNDKNEFYLITNGDSILAWNHLENALGYYENGYNAAHARGVNASSGAIMSFLMMSPAIISVEDASDIENRLLGPGPWTMSSIWGEGGGAYGVKCEAEGVSQEWENGERPRLIS